MGTLIFLADMEQEHITALAEMTSDWVDTLHTHLLDTTLQMGTPAMTPIRFFWKARNRVQGKDVEEVDRLGFLRYLCLWTKCLNYWLAEEVFFRILGANNVYTSRK